MTTNNMLAESKFYMGYSRWDDVNDRYETWEDSVDRVMNMHREKYKDVMTSELNEAINFATDAYKEKLVLGAQRALQFGGEQIFKHESRIYNCAVSYVDRPAFFNECMYQMLCGVGVGFSVLKKYVDKLPTIARRSQKKAKIFQIPDSIEGWADAFGVLLSSYFTEGATHPEYRGCQVHFDYSKIRPMGSKISGGFKAPGPDGLRKALIKCEDLLESLLTDKPINKINTITAYDFVMHQSDAVLSGGVRRCLPGDTLIQLDVDLWKPISEVTSDDKVLFDGEYFNIINRFDQGIQSVNKILLDDGTYLESTDKHRWFVYNAELDIMEWVATSDLKPHHAMIQSDDSDSIAVG